MTTLATSREFYLADVESTLFPLNTNMLLVDKFSKEIQAFLQEVVLASGGGFQQQHRAFASKKGWYLRPTLKLDPEEITEILLDHIDSDAQIPEFQLFWFARMAESYLLKTPRVGELLLKLYEHESATDISKAKVLEIPENKFGLVDIREEQLKTGHSDWLAWTAAVGTRKQPKGQRNQMLKYFRKSSPMNRLIGEFVESCF